MALSSDQISQIKKVDLGGGHQPKEGYANVDLYVEEADVKADILHLPFSDGQLDEINASHILEHLPKDDVILALKECYRTLRADGWLAAEVPDLEDVVRDWLAVDESQRWGIRIQRIYGLECHPGEFHKTGFTVNRLRSLLIEAGFVNAAVVSVYSEAHGHHVLVATARR